MSEQGPVSMAYPHGRWLLWALGVLGLSIVAALAWAQFRSFDLLDGGYYFLMYADPSDNADRSTHFELLGRPIWLICGQNIVAFRMATLALVSGAGWALFRSLRHLMPEPAFSAAYGFPIWLAAIAGVVWVPVALTYNSLATLFGCAALAFLAPKGRTEGAFRLVAFAILVFGAYLAKPPAALALAAGGYFLLAQNPDLGEQARRRIHCVAVAVAVSILVLIFGWLNSPDKTLHILGLTLGWPWVEQTLARYAKETALILPRIGGDFAWTVIPTMLACAVVLFFDAKPNAGRFWKTIALLLVVFLLGTAVVERRLWDGSFAAAVEGGATRFYLLIWGTLLPVAVLGAAKSRSNWKGRLTIEGAWILVFLCLPLVSSFGSTNTVFVSARHMTVFWSAGLLLTAAQIGRSLDARWFAPALGVLLSLGAAAHIYTGHFLRPYMFQPNLWSQTESVSIGNPASTVKVYPALASFLGEVEQTLKSSGFKPGDDLFAFFNLPGVVFAVGGREPGAPWYFGTWYSGDDLDGYKLRLVSPSRRLHAWLITQADVRPFGKRFLAAGIDFPGGYTKIGQTVNPASGLEIEIWKPRTVR